MSDKLKKGSELFSQKVRLNVNYNATLVELRNKGKFDWVHTVLDGFINMDAPIFETQFKGVLLRDIYIVHFDRTLKTREVETLMEKYGFAPCGLEELFALGEQFPLKQRENPIVALNYILRMPGSKPGNEDKISGCFSKVELAEKEDRKDKAMFRPFRVVLDKRGGGRIVNITDADAWEAGHCFLAYKKEE